MEIKKNIPNNTITRKLVDLDKDTGNIYESINIIARRANQISTELKAELTCKLAVFSSPTDTMEECASRRVSREAGRGLSCVRRVSRAEGGGERRFV